MMAPFSFSELIPKVRGELLLNESLARYTTIKIGGPADALFYPADLEDLKMALSFCQASKIPYFVLGNGSNLLVRSGGVRGLVIRLNKGLQEFRPIDQDESHSTFFVEAGFSLAKLVEFSKRHGLSGMESLYGIPGSIGGALAMNAGTREGEIGNVVEEIQTINPDGRVKHYPRPKLKWEYRQSGLPRTEIIVAAHIRLKKTEPEVVAEKIEFFQKRRQKTQPLDQPSFGSVFKNPAKKFAAQLIDELGLKGVRVGGARISEKHANWIVNEGQATAEDVLVLIGLIKDKVKAETGIRLETEVKIVGEAPE